MEDSVAFNEIKNKNNFLKIFISKKLLNMFEKLLPRIYCFLIKNKCLPVFIKVFFSQW